MTTNSSNLDRLEELLRRKNAGELTEAQFTAEKEHLLGPEPSVDHPAAVAGSPRGMPVTGFLVLLIGFGLFHYNGWAFERTIGLYGYGSEAGIYLGQFGGAQSIFIRIGDHWQGLARTNTDALLIDAPMLNIALLVIGLMLFFEGFKLILFGTPAGQDQTR